MQKENKQYLKSDGASLFTSGVSNTGASTRGTSVAAKAGTVEDTLEANDMLIDAIKAKLAILDNLE
jgi:hypothetical protein